MTDQELIQGCKKNNRKAQSFLYENYGSRVMGICRRYGHGESEAEDIFQEAFVKVFKSIGSLKNHDALWGWMKRVVINTAINYYKKHQKHHGQVREEYAIDSQATDSSIISQLSNDELLSLIQALPSGYQLVFNLYAIEGYTHKEVAKLLSISEGTSKSQYSRAKSLLQKQVKAMYTINNN